MAYGICCEMLTASYCRMHPVRQYCTRWPSNQSRVSPLCCAANLHDIGADILSRRRHLSAPFLPCPSHITVYLGNLLRMYLVPELPPAYFLVYQT
jgi:hypothetical protein